MMVDDTHLIEAGRLAVDRQTGNFGASIVGTLKLDRRPSASLRVISGRCA